MPIKPEVLKTLRKRKKLSRQQLAERTKLSLRQLARLESGTASSTKVRERTLEQLAKVLGVEQGVLTGEQALPEAAPIPEERADQGERVQVSAALLPEVRLAYSLIQRRYGVNMTTIINSAPLLFILLAEKSLAWRREKIERADEAVDEIRKLYDSYALEDPADYDSGLLYWENEFITKLNLFGPEGLGSENRNPFAVYLRELANGINDPDVIEISDNKIFLDGPIEGFPVHNLCKEELYQISNHSPAAWAALKYGDVRVSDIPKELWAEGAAEERAEWLEAKLSEESLFRIADYDLGAVFALKNGDARVSDIPKELWAEDAAKQRAEWLQAHLSQDVLEQIKAVKAAKAEAIGEQGQPSADGGAADDAPVPLGDLPDELPTEDGR